MLFEQFLKGLKCENATAVALNLLGMCRNQDFNRNWPEV